MEIKVEIISEKESYCKGRILEMTLWFNKEKNITKVDIDLQPEKEDARFQALSFMEDYLADTKDFSDIVKRLS